jgi:hypothetical protein
MRQKQLNDVIARAVKNVPNRSAILAFALVIAMFFTGCAAAPKDKIAGNFYHVGLIWLKEPGNAEHRQKIIAAAHSFRCEIPEVEFLAVGQSPPSTSPYVDDSFDISFVIRLADKAALDRYGKHPVHAKAAQEVFLPLSSKIQFYDYIAE